MTAVRRPKSRRASTMTTARAATLATTDNVRTTASECPRCIHSRSNR